MRDATKRIWVRVDGPVAIIVSCVTMFFAGFFFASYLDRDERIGLVTAIKDARADGIKSCNAAWADIYAKQTLLLGQQKNLLDQAVASSQRTEKKADAIIDNQKRNSTVRKSEVKAAATTAASEVAARSESEARAKINNAVRGR